MTSAAECRRRSPKTNLRIARMPHRWMLAAHVAGRRHSRVAVDAQDFRTRVERVPERVHLPALSRCLRSSSTHEFRDSNGTLLRYRAGMMRSVSSRAAKGGDSTACMLSTNEKPITRATPHAAACATSTTSPASEAAETSRALSRWSSGALGPGKLRHWGGRPKNSRLATVWIHSEAHRTAGGAPSNPAL